MSLPRLGVVLVTFNSENVIIDCLESLLAAHGVLLSIVVVDNASTDDTVALLRQWAAGTVSFTPSADLPFSLRPTVRFLTLNDAPSALGDAHQVALIEAGFNGGFAAGVNRGLAALAGLTELDRFWILNPDSVVPPSTPAALAAPCAPFALMGCRVVYLEEPNRIQIDGGTIEWATGVTGNTNLGAPHTDTPAPDPASFDFITGASMVASRTFYETVGPMAEDYFLYYEEVDWALRRGALPLTYCPDAIVYHRAGTAIGSPTLGRPASSFSLYFKHRARMKFLWRHAPRALPTGLAYSVAKTAQLLLKGYPQEALTLLRASLGLPPPRDVRSRLSPEAQRHAFGSHPAKSRR